MRQLEMMRPSKRGRGSEASAGSVKAPRAHILSAAPGLLTAVAVVCRAQSRLTGMEHQAGIISSFLDSACDHWTLESVLSGAPAWLDEASAVRLLGRLLAHEWAELSAEFRMDRFLENVERAGEQSKTQILDWWLTEYLPLNEDTAKHLMQCAIDWNRVHVLERLEQQRLLPDPKELVIECRHADTTYWLHERGYSLSIDVEIEIGQDNLAFMKWVEAHKQQHILRDLERGIVAASSMNCFSIEMAQWLLDTFPETDWDEPEENEHDEVDLAMAKWLEHKFVWSEGEVYVDDVDGREIEIEGDSAHKFWINNLMEIAVEASQLDAVKYLYDHRLYDPRCDRIVRAAQLGHMEIVQFLHDKDPSCSKFAVDSAAQGVHLKIVQWLHEQVAKGRTLKRRGRHRHEPNRSIDMAAESGSLELIQWLHSHRPKECTRNAMDNAASAGHVHILQWLHANRKEGCSSDALYDAASNGHLEVVQWLLKNRKECKRQQSVAMDAAAAFGHFELVKWIHESRSGTCTTKAVDDAAEGGYLDIVKFLLENRSEGCTEGAMSGAVFHGQFKVLKYLIESGFASYPEQQPVVNRAGGSTSDFDDSDDEEYVANPIDQAAELGYAHIVRLLHERCGLRCGKYAISKSNSFAVLEWVMRNDPSFADFDYQQSRGYRMPKKETHRYLTGGGSE